MPRIPKHSRVGERLRNEGFVLLPPLWVYAKHMPEIHEITGRASQRVNEVRAEVREQNHKAADPRLSRDDAWDVLQQTKDQK